jgi:hypothetical protein
MLCFPQIVPLRATGLKNAIFRNNISSGGCTMKRISVVARILSCARVPVLSLVLALCLILSLPVADTPKDEL